ncbi:hypothetical protein CC80DRAFT_465621 [Byssothecium circinans]|uniref:G domain-containing protein n=1 Tax=Byssothecium circinans TaxID=147558 RepID=A0A6A5U895_9PLEO|nr:hypothetical protein CC80DRAFT_465621 [Byssothecium circinans]
MTAHGPSSDGRKSSAHRANQSGTLPLEPPNLKPEDVVIAVMGVTGCGKTTFVNYFADYQLQVGNQLMSCTQNVQVVPCTLEGNGKIYLVDTPGFDDSMRTDSEILREVAAWLNQAYKSQIKLSGIIYLHRITDVRIPGSGTKNLRMFKRLCGDDGLKSVVLATTMWENTSEEEGARRESELVTNPIFWKPMIEQGSRLFRQNAGRASGDKIMQYLIRRKRPVTLTLQHEMAQGLELGQTGAGAEVVQAVEKEKEYYGKQLRDLENELRDALTKRDLDRKEELEELKTQFEDKISRGQHDVRQLQVDSDKLYEEMKQQHEKEMAELAKQISEKDLAIQQTRIDLALMKESHAHELERQDLEWRLKMKDRALKMYRATCIVM